MLSRRGTEGLIFAIYACWVCEELIQEETDHGSFDRKARPVTSYQEPVRIHLIPLASHHTCHLPRYQSRPRHQR